MSPKKSSDPEEPPPLLRELELELDRELELDELLRELELDDREPPLKEWPPPGRASKKVMRGAEATLCATAVAPSLAAADPAGTMTIATAITTAKGVRGRCRRSALMRAARPGAR